MGLAQKARQEARDSKPPDEQVTAAFKEMHLKDGPAGSRRCKRPDQQVYVPKHLKNEQASARIMDSRNANLENAASIRVPVAEALPRSVQSNDRAPGTPTAETPIRRDTVPHAPSTRWSHKDSGDSVNAFKSENNSNIQQHCSPAGDGLVVTNAERTDGRRRPATQKEDCRTRRSAPLSREPPRHVAPPRQRTLSYGDHAEDVLPHSARTSGRKKKHRPKEERGKCIANGICNKSHGAAEEDWEGDLLVVTNTAFASQTRMDTSNVDSLSELTASSQHGDLTQNESSRSPAENADEHIVSKSPEFIKDWSAVVAEEDDRLCCSPVESLQNDRTEPLPGPDTRRRNSGGDAVRRPSESAKVGKSSDQQVPPRFQKKVPTTPSPPRLEAGKAGLLRIPSSVRLGEGEEGSVQDKPLIAVKPQPQVPVGGGYGRGTPAVYSPPYDMAPLLQYAGTVPCGYQQGVPGSGIVPVYHSDQVMAPDVYGRSRIKPLVEKNLHDAALLEREFMTYLSKGIQNTDMKAMGHCRWKLQLRYENVILADPRYCAERNVEQALWKSAFYHGIETFRRAMEECPEHREEAKMHLLALVDEGTIFYENLLDKFQETYGFSLKPFLEAEGAPRPPGLPDSVRLVLISAQKIYICLGDLARYREQALGTTNYGRARNYYLKAQQLAPKNGRPYNQLAILAIYARRKLDAVYYYMRSLAASNPFLTARESLLALFDEARKKYEHIEKKRQEEKTKQPESQLIRRLSQCGDERLEVWIRPDGTSSHRSSRDLPDDGRGDELGELDRLSTVELNKRFVLSFLHVHGKLFTRVGMETFSETAQRMLMEFRCLLQRSPAAVASARHLQLLSINMFTVANTSLKDSNLDPQCRSLLQEQSLQVTLAHVAILLERAAALVEEQESNEGQSLPDDLLELLPCLKVWTDWMSCQKRLWSPPPTPCDYNTSVKGNVWTTLAELLTVLRNANLGHIKFFKEPAEDRELVTLPEDSTLAGFVPLLGAPQENYYVQVPCNKEQVRNYLRISRIQFFGDYLCGISTPYLEFNVEKKRFVSLITVSDEDTDSEKEITFDSSDDDLDMCDSLEDQEVPLNCDEDSEIQKLWSKKEQLRKAKDQRDRHQACVQAVLQEHRNKQATMLEIRPRYLFPDTNCFIDHLPLLQRLVADGHFHVYVPLVVINELDGLTRGTRQSMHQSVEHLHKVATTAKAALNYLEDRFSHREPKLRCVTSRGSILDTICFRSEDVSDNKGTNDDLILSCCRHYCSDRPDHLLPRELDAPLKLYREAVLITEDRNLCVKALTHHVPVRDLPSFLRWANISS
uniref:Telomerase-binding protein EST1A n=1 Tax=Ornithodoros turicata TaxID=34597 RepID=A0A2R5LHI5_9ACAR